MRDETEQHGQLCVLRHITLDDKRRLLGLEAHRKEVQGDLNYRTSYQIDIVEVVPQRLVVGDQEVTLVFVLQADPILQGANVVTQVKSPCRANPSEYARPRRRPGACGWFLVSLFVGHGHLAYFGGIKKPRSLAGAR